MQSVALGLLIKPGSQGRGLIFCEDKTYISFASIWKVTYHEHSKNAEVVTLTDHPVQKLVTNSLASICAPITLTTCCDVIRWNMTSSRTLNHTYLEQPRPSRHTAVLGTPEIKRYHIFSGKNLTNSHSTEVSGWWWPWCCLVDYEPRSQSQRLILGKRPLETDRLVLDHWC